MAAVIWIDPESLPFEPQAVRQRLAPDVEHHERASESIADAPPFDVAVISAAGPDPLRTARALHDRAPAADLIFAASPPEAAALKSRLLLVPRIGRHWLILDCDDPAAAAEAIGRAVRSVQGRRQLRTTLDRMNVRLAKEEDPMRLRRMAISDRLLASLLKQAPDPILALDLDGKVETANRAAASFFGSELRGRTLAPVLDEPGSAKLEAAIESRGDARFRTGLADGDQRILELSITPVRGDGGDPMGFSIVARDVTSEQRAQHIDDFLHRASEILFSSLKWSETFERAARAAVPFLGELCVIDVMEEGELVRKTVATAHSELLGPGASETGRPVTLHPDHPAARAIATGEAITTIIDDRLWRAVAPEAPASSRPGKASLNLPLRIRGTVAGAISFLSWEREYDAVDVATGLEFARRAALALDNARLYEEAERANRSKDEFLATLSHELRTPMTSILGWSRLLEMDAVDPQLIAEASTSIRRSAETQAQLIDDLLDVSRIVAGKLRINIEKVSLATIVEASIGTVVPAAEARGITIETDLDPTVTVRGDSARLQQVVWNLLSNAVKFTPKGGTVCARVDRDRSHARISVSDTGEGIPPDFLPHLFERFRQLEGGTRRSMGGLGLGLAIVRHLIELHGGTITAESAGAEKGATFTILLPIAAAFDVQESEQRRSKAERAAAGASMPDLSGASLLVVEDDEESRRVIATILRAAGAEVRQAASVAEAIRALELRRPDLVVSDIAMPGQDGFDMIRHLRARYEPGEMPSIALTAYGQPEERDRILRAGFDRYIMKPVDPVALATAVAETLAKV